MRYHALQQLRRGLTLASARALYRWAPARLRLSQFLESRVSWEDIGRSSPSRAALVDYSLRQKFDRLRFLIDQDDVTWFLQSDPFSTHHSTVQRAQEACAHRIEITNLGVVDLGNTLEWRRDPVTGSMFPANLFSVRPPSGVDERFRAELNCHRHFPVLALAARISGDPRYARALLAQWRTWLATNPPVDDTFLNDGLETTIRVLCWSHCLSLLGAGAVDEQFCLGVLARIEAYGHLIEKNHKHTPLANNHQVAEALGLLLIGLLYPEFRSSPRWLETGVRLLQQELDTQLLPGGVHSEQSAAYHLFVLDCLQLALLLCRRNDVPVAASFSVKIEEATDYLMQLLRPDATLPLLGDDCGLRLLSPTGATGLRPKTALAVGAYLFDRPDMAAVAGEPDEDIFWLLGRDGISWLRNACQEAKPAERVRFLPETGHAVVRSGWEPTSHYLHFGFGPQGLGERPGHCHDDVLSFELQALGQRFIVDAGTYTYLRTHPLRQYFTGARGHSSILVDPDRSARLASGPLGWRAVAGELLSAGIGEDLVWVTARHLGYLTGDQDVVVERSLLAVKNEYVLIVDYLSGSGMHTVESLLHLAPDLRVSMGGASIYCRGPRANLLVAHMASAPTQWSLHWGDDPVQPGWHSPCYGTIVEAPVLRATTQTVLPFWRVTGLFPACEKAVSEIQLDARPGGGGVTEETITVVIDGWQANARDLLRLRWSAKLADTADGERIVFTRDRPAA